MTADSIGTENSIASKRILSIDLETYSDVDIKTCGVYRYVEGDFHILLFAYAFDDEPVQIVDLACGEELPQDVVDAIFDENIIKAAWNAQFERTCLSKYFGTQLSPDSWRCSMVHAASLSLPLKLGDSAKVLKVSEQKDKAGENLIKYFSVPCKPTKKNGGRTRNLPEHDMEKWELFKSYCLQDVRTERAIRKKIEQYPILEHEWDFYHMDQRINDRGVLIDSELVAQAIKCDQIQADAMLQKAHELTGLENPNSVAQLKSWLTERGIPVEKLGKEDVVTLLDDLEKNSTDQEAIELLKLRQKMSKSSIKKYQAAERCVCKDGRARGLFQFSGANRTQRWGLAEGTPVLIKTQSGLITEKPIEAVSNSDMVFDGNNWVNHDGVVFSGNKEVIFWDGITATPEHMVFIDSEHKISLLEAKEKGIRLWRGECAVTAKESKGMVSDRRERT